MVNPVNVQVVDAPVRVGVVQAAGVVTAGLEVTV